MTHFTENGQPYSPALAIAQVASIMVGAYLAVALLRAKFESNEQKGMTR
jgi:hypothetical protein